ncbi:MAG: hypothetical protein RBQ72_09420 [Desulfobacterium sp.]|jgi:hypothetical protein|nr:hypothetical protein [Desulfobacterium sp.]
MKKRAVLRVLGIGLLHTFLYLWLVPFVVYPRFGQSGLMMTVVIALLISIVLVSTIFICRK